MPIHDGTLRLPGYEIDPVILPTTKLFPIAAQEARFDLTEMSLLTSILQLSKAATADIALPVFLSRAFRPNGFFARI